MRRTVTIVLIAFAGFFVCAYPGETVYVLSSMVNGVSFAANALATSIATFFRTLFA